LECEVVLAVVQGFSRRGCKSFLGIFARKIIRLPSRAFPKMLLEEYLAIFGGIFGKFARKIILLS
jgi:hypothetical protein